MTEQELIEETRKLIIANIERNKGKRDPVEIEMEKLLGTK